MGYLGYLKNENNLIRSAVVGGRLFVSDDYPWVNAAKLPVSNDELAVEIRIALPTAQAVDLVAVVGHNLTENAVITVKAGSDIDVSDYSNPMTTRRRTSFLKIASPQTYQFWRIEIKDETNTHEFIDIGYLVLGQVTTLDFSFREGWVRRDTIRKIGAEDNYRKLNELETISINFDAVTETSTDTLRDLFEAAVDEPLFVIPDIDENDGFFGRFDPQFTREFTLSKSGTGESGHRVTCRVRITEDASAIKQKDDVLFYWEAGQDLPSNGRTFSRASTAFYKDRDLKLVSAAVDEIRSDHWFSENQRGLLLEHGSENLLTYSEDMSTGKTPVRVSVSTDVADAPDGNATADLVVPSIDNDTHYIYDFSDYSNFTDDTPMSVSVFLKAGGYGYAHLGVRSKAGSIAYVFVNLSTGAIVSTSDASGILHFYLVEKYADDWWRVLIAADSEAGTTNPLCLVKIYDNSQNSTYVGDGSSGVHIWGMQLEADTYFPTSYIKTVASTATREVDSLKWEFRHIAQSLSVYTEITDIGSWKDESGIWHIGANAAYYYDPRAELRAESSGGEKYKWQAVFDTGESAGGGSTNLDNSTDRAIGENCDVVVYIGPNCGCRIEMESASSGLFYRDWLDDPYEWGQYSGSDGGTLHLNNRGTVSPGLLLLSKLKILRGGQSLATMRALSRAESYINNG